MVLIYVAKSWLSLIGAAASKIQIVSSDDASPDDSPDSSVCLVANKTEIEHPFLMAELVRKEQTASGSLALTSYIPLHVVRGMFKLSHDEKKKLGFLT